MFSYFMLYKQFIGHESLAVGTEYKQLLLLKKTA